MAAVFTCFCSCQKSDRSVIDGLKIASVAELRTALEEESLCGAAAIVEVAVTSVKPAR